MTPAFFATPAAFGARLRTHHARRTELLVGFHKKESGKPSMTWPESVDEALCFGWIDGVRRAFDAESYTIRFTPRKPRSIWSDVNTKKALALIESGRMRPAGLKAFEARDEKRAGIYAFEQKAAGLSDDELAAFGSSGRRGHSGRRSQPVTGARRGTGSQARSDRRRADDGSRRCWRIRRRG